MHAGALQCSWAHLLSTQKAAAYSHEMGALTGRAGPTLSPALAGYQMVLLTVHAHKARGTAGRAMKYWPRQNTPLATKTLPVSLHAPSHKLHGCDCMQVLDTSLHRSKVKLAVKVVLLSVKLQLPLLKAASRAPHRTACSTEEYPSSPSHSLQASCAARLGASIPLRPLLIATPAFMHRAATAPALSAAPQCTGSALANGCPNA